MLAALSELLRELLRGDPRAEVALAVELELARRYLDVMSYRFGDRLAIEIDVPAELGDALVPRLVLQPLLENALRHGVAQRTGRATLGVTARRAGDGVEIAVTDDGP